MGRRADHTRDQLNAMALKAARKIVAKHGLRGLSTRRIAAAMGYAPGTLYQLFEDLDDLILHLNGTTLEALYAHCKEIEMQGEVEVVLDRLADCYLSFVGQNPGLWAAVVEHNLPNGRET